MNVKCKPTSSFTESEFGELEWFWTNYSRTYHVSPNFFGSLHIEDAIKTILKKCTFQIITTFFHMCLSTMTCTKQIGIFWEYERLTFLPLVYFLIFTHMTNETKPIRHSEISKIVICFMYFWFYKSSFNKKYIPSY